MSIYHTQNEGLKCGGGGRGWDGDLSLSFSVILCHSLWGGLTGRSDYSMDGWVGGTVNEK